MSADTKNTDEVYEELDKFIDSVRAAEVRTLNAIFPIISHHKTLLTGCRLTHNIQYCSGFRNVIFIY